MVFAKQIFGQAATMAAGDTGPVGRPTPGRTRIDNRIWFLQNKGLGRQSDRAYSTSGQSSIWTFSLAPSSATGISSGTIAKPFA